MSPDPPAALYLDHNISNELLRLLTHAGHRVYSARTLRMSAANDLEHLLAATDRGAVLITHDKKDFLLLHRTWLALARRWSAVETHPGIHSARRGATECP